MNTYKARITIDKAVADLIAPVISNSDLGSDALLSKCLHGQTKNVNESINNLIWTRCPKRVYVGNSVFKTAVASAVIAFNDGSQGLLPLFERFGIDCGYFTTEGSKKSDSSRIKLCNRKSTDKEKLRRKKLRAIRKGFNDKHHAEEGETYSSGAF